MLKKEFTYHYNGKTIPYDVWVTDNSGIIETIIFLGTVQIEKIPLWIAEKCPPKTAIVQGAPHWLAKDDGSDIPEYMLGYAKSVLESTLANFTVDKLHAIADSQSVPSVVKMFSLDKYSPYMQDMVLIQPLGLTKNIFDGTDYERIKLFKKRVLENICHQLIHLMIDGRLRYNYELIGKMIDFSNPKARAQYNSGLKLSSLDDLTQLYEINNKITIICGAKDKIFPANEIENNLKKYNLPIAIHKIKGVLHSPLATKQGVKLLVEALASPSSQSM
jgi:hypothetical protein